MIKNNTGRYIESGFTTDCNGEDCDGAVVMVKALSPGMYTVEMTASGHGGEFRVDMMCSPDLVGIEDDVSVIECGQSIHGVAQRTDKAVSLRIINELEQNMMITASNDTFT